MKKFWSVAAALCLTVLLLAVPPAEASEMVTASLTASEVYINDQRADIAGYYIDGSNYFRIRDVAAALEGTSCQFDVTWNADLHQVELTAKTPYSGMGEGGGLPESAVAAPSAAGLLVDGQFAEAAAYNIQGSTYYRLRDLGELLDFDVFWLEATDTVCLYTELDGCAQLAESGGGAVRLMNREKSTQRWGQTCNSYLYANGDQLCVLDVSEGEDGPYLTLDIYEAGSLTLLESRQIPRELSLFGGFYAGEHCNYIVFGSNNTASEDDREVVRVVKYDKDFLRLGEASVTGGEIFTLRPFDAGTLRMSEYGGELVIHTSRAEYALGGGSGSASQLTLVLDTETMTVTNDPRPYMDAYVSRSFNQFVQHDESGFFLLDLGDASPRGIVLHRFRDGGYTAAELLHIPGSAGAGCTGVGVGGFALSPASCLTAINTVDHTQVSAYTDYTLEGLSPEERNVVLLVSSKEDPSLVDQVVLTDYIGRGMLGSTPYLVKLSEERFLVLWEEFTYYETEAGFYGVRDGGVRYVEVDGNGQPLTPVNALEGAHLSYDCEPVVLDGQVVWYVNGMAGRVFYSIGV